jgi:hypothetical protein
VTISFYCKYYWPHAVAYFIAITNLIFTLIVLTFECGVEFETVSGFIEYWGW